MRIKQGFLLIGTFLAACALLIFPSQAAQGAKNGVGYCLGILIPSLYPFMVISVFIVKSGLSEKIGKIFEKPTRKILKLPGCTAATILMSAVGGYPTGARSVASLYEIGAVTQKQAARMLCFCVNAGPAFVISAIGSGFLKSTDAGVILFASQICASFILSIICSVKQEFEDPSLHNSIKVKKITGSEALIQSAVDAAHGMINMCCFVVLFSAYINLFNIWVKSPSSSVILSSLMEVTGGCGALTKIGAPLWAFSLALGWGGISVHFQILSSITDIKINTVKFFLYRFLHGIISAFITFVLCRAFPIEREVFSSTSKQLSGQLSGSIPASAVLIVLCAALIFSFPHEKLEIEDT
jgi:sporulation integral membrane protein YlbJ